MEPHEHQLLLETSEGMLELQKNRDDMVIGVAAVLLDVYRLNIAKGVDTKADAVGRLTVQKDWLAKEVHDQVGAKFLGFLIATLEADKLDAAKWLLRPVAGSA